MTDRINPLERQMCYKLTILLQRIGCGEEDALAEFHEETESRLNTYIGKIVKDYWQAQEVLQDVYLHIWQKAPDYSRERGTPLAWIYMLARSRALDSLRRNSKQSAMTELDDQVLPASPVTGSVAPPEVWWYARVRRGVHELPVSQGRLIGLAFFEGYTHS